jgi:aryl-alcohol dehydrogenase-like predicted oxidoreductase
MEYRHLGNCGLKVSAISYGNWITHGSQLEVEQATACVRAALDVGITTFDTADVYASGRAESILGKALKGEHRDGLEIFTKVYFPTGPGANHTGLSRKHIHEAINASLRRLKTDYVDLYQAHRYDYSTPLIETMQAFADVVRAGKALYIGVSEWTAAQIREAHALAAKLGISLVSNQPRYNALYRIIEADVIPTCQELGVSQVVFSPMEQGILSGKYDLASHRRITRVPRMKARERGSSAEYSTTTCSTACSSWHRWLRRRVSRWLSLRWRGSCRTTTSPAPSTAHHARSR